jgi:hypothetical protein
LLYCVPVDHATIGNPRRHQRESCLPESYRRRGRPFYPIQLSLRATLDRTGSPHPRTPRGDRACRHEARATSSPCPARSVATRACDANPCRWTSSSCGSGRV